MSITKKFHISMAEDVLKQVEERGEARSTVITRDLERLYTLYRRALKRTDLTIDEACLITDALNSSLMTADTAHLLWASIEDAIKYEGLHKKWGVDGKALVEKLRSLNEIQSMAIIDAAEKFWNNEKYRDQDMKIGVAECFGSVYSPEKSKEDEQDE